MQGDEHLQHKLKAGLETYRMIIKSNTKPSIFSRFTGALCNRTRVYIRRSIEYETNSTKSTLTSQTYDFKGFPRYSGYHIVHWSYQILNKYIFTKIRIIYNDPDSSNNYAFNLMVINTSYTSMSNKSVFNDILSNIYNNDVDQYHIFFCKNNKLDIGYLKPGVPLICDKKVGICLHIPLHAPMIDLSIVGRMTNLLSKHNSNLPFISFNLPRDMTEVNEKKRSRYNALKSRYNTINQEEETKYFYYGSKYKQ